MLTLLIGPAENDSIIPEESSARVVWAVIGARRKADEERIANDPDMRKD
jgi:hypothetical protein